MRLYIIFYKKILFNNIIFNILCQNNMIKIMKKYTSKFVKNNIGIIIDIA